MLIVEKSLNQQFQTHCHRSKINVLENQSLREGIKIYSDWPTIPQLYIKKEFIGGCDIVKEMYENGELKTVLEKNGIDYKKN